MSQSSSQPQRSEVHPIQRIPINLLDPFPNHPFKVLMNEDMGYLIESIQREGILTPIIVRANNRAHYQIISGHRRVRACAELHMETIPAVVVAMSDVEATILMVDSNIARQSLLPSEKAFAYKMRLEAIKHQGKKTESWLEHISYSVEGLSAANNASCHGGDTLSSSSCHGGEMNESGTLCHDGTKALPQNQQDLSKIAKSASMGELSGITRSSDIISQLSAESSRTIHRYIRLTYLISDLLEMVDGGKMGITPAVELSYLDDKSQQLLFTIMAELDVKPSVPQASRLKEIAQNESLTESVIYDLLSEEKPNQREKLFIEQAQVAKYFPSHYNAEQMRNTIISLVRNWSHKRGYTRAGDNK